MGYNVLPIWLSVQKKGACEQPHQPDVHGILLGVFVSDAPVVTRDGMFAKFVHLKANKSIG